jgi:phosphoglucosamine mutase
MKREIPRLFGTDGIRGLANAGPLHVSQVCRLGEATAALLARRLRRRPRVGLGWDTRRSAPMLGAALTAGLASGGAEVLSFGELPTPAVALLTRDLGLDLGAVVSASHNPADDNGIKYFSAGGGKFPEGDERRLERALAGPERPAGATGTGAGAVRDASAEAHRHYARTWTARFAKARLAGLKVVADYAHGAACRTAPAVLAGLGISVQGLNDAPDGLNINVDCGSLHPQALARATRTRGADAGLAFDGDADRVILSDERGRVLNGDRMLAVLALNFARQGRLPKRRVVGTVMTNLGLERFLRARGIELLRAPVGDKYVAQVMARQGLALGGEQSGHLLLPHLFPTGDGLVTALAVLSAMRAAKRPLSELAGGWADFPQLLVNVRVARRPDLERVPAVRGVLDQARRALGDRGRINLRYSGTEPLARVMVEAETRDQALAWGERLAGAVAAAIGDGHRRTLTWLTSA